VAERVYPNTVIKEMAVTPKEFLQMIRTSAGADAVDVEKDRILLTTAYGQLSISLTVMPSRRIASLELPVTRVEYDYSGWKQNDQLVQQQWLDLHLRRGGG